MGKLKYNKAFSLVEMLIILLFLSLLLSLIQKPKAHIIFSKENWSLNYLYYQSLAMAEKHDKHYENISFYNNGYVYQGMTKKINGSLQKVVIRIAQGRLRWE